MARVVRKPGPGREVLRATLAGLEDKTGKVGWFENAKYEGGTPVAYVAAINEYGVAGKIPARPFMRPTVAQRLGEWRNLVQRGAKAITRGEATSTTVMEAVTQTAAGNIAETIAGITSPALAESTVKNRLRKKADGKTIGNLTKPLIDTKLMINSLTSVVEDK